MAEVLSAHVALHQGQPVLVSGRPLERAQAALVLLHGRGGTARAILRLADELAQPGLVCLAPQAAANVWYPNSFSAPIASNEPYLSSALAAVGDVLARLGQAGIPPERVVLLGFSQGACLVLEFAARHVRRYGGVAGLSGALIGPDDVPRRATGSLAGTPVFLGCGTADPYIPRARVEYTERVLRQLGSQVTMRLYPNLGHTVTPDELESVRGMLSPLTTRSGYGPED
jgi:predicted esterase